MFKRVLTVVHSPVKNNFVLLPDVYLRLINTTVRNDFFLLHHSVENFFSLSKFIQHIEIHDVVNVELFYFYFFFLGKCRTDAQC